MRGSGSRRLMANSQYQDKCITRLQQCADHLPGERTARRIGWIAARPMAVARDDIFVMGRPRIETRGQPLRYNAEPQVNGVELAATKILPEGRPARCRKLWLR